MRLKSYLKAFTGVFIVLFLSADLFAQTYEERREELLQRQKNTRAEINVLEARIKNYQDRISQTEVRFERSFEQVQSFNNLIALQDDKIQSLQEEQKQIEAEIELTEDEIELRENELEHLIENYQKIILYAYKNGRTGNLELLLTSESINQMLVRSNYLRRFEEQKNKQTEVIKEAKKELDEVKAGLQDSYQKNRVVIDEIQQEKEKLGDQRELQEQTVEEIKRERSNWVAEIQKAREQKENLENTFASLIEEEEEIRDSERTSTSEITRENFVSDEVLLTYEESFAQSKGVLPWPVNSKTVAKKFGRVRNPLYGTNTDHPGIDIVSDSGAPVSSVSDGYVMKILPMRGYGDVVFVKHGSYYTAYGNLSRIDVRLGDVVGRGDTIGASGTAQSELGEVLFFAVRQGNEFVNPVNWLGN